MALIETLRKDHQTLVEVLNQVNVAGITTPEGQRLLLAAKQGLLDHLAREDRELYPVLRSAAEKDEKLKRTMKVFAEDMGQISGAAIGFFDKYAQGGSGIEFARELGRLLVTLGGRIRKEESILFKEYEKLAG